MKVTHPFQLIPERPSRLVDASYLAGGCLLLALTTWRWNVAAAAWLAPVLLMRFTRDQRRWYVAALALPAMALASFANKRTAWGFELDMEILTGCLAVLPLFLALMADRYTAKRLAGIAGSLVFPAIYVTLDYSLSFAPLGTVFSLAPSQFAVKPVLQLAALTGVWGIDFLVTWLAPVANQAWEGRAQLSRARIPVVAYCACLLAVLLGAGLRMVLLSSPQATVRVAGVTVAHPRNYWDSVVDRGTPRELAQGLAPELATLEDRLFAESERAAEAGAQIIFWSEGNAVMLPGHRDAFLQRAKSFARQHGVYLVPSYLVFQYGAATGDNGLVMIGPDGEIAYRYSKTMSWYATDSDGILRSVQTPFGRISTAICFDMDFPAFIRQAAGQGVDIMLVPAFDTFGTRPYHTEVGVMRGVDYGFAVVRQVNEGMSMAVDNRGSVLAQQDFYATDHWVMLADVPVRRTTTLYGRLGDWFAWLCSLVAMVGLVAAVAVGRRAASARQGAQAAAARRA
jgi:apolipoprotein N-acyltransferase